MHRSDHSQSVHSVYVFRFLAHKLSKRLWTLTLSPTHYLCEMRIFDDFSHIMPTQSFNRKSPCTGLTTRSLCTVMSTIDFFKLWYFFELYAGLATEIY